MIGVCSLDMNRYKFSSAWKSNATPYIHNKHLPCWSVDFWMIMSENNVYVIT